LTYRDAGELALECTGPESLLPYLNSKMGFIESWVQSAMHTGLDFGQIFGAVIRKPSLGYALFRKPFLKTLDYNFMMIGTIHA
jgi:hypothetical protein